MSCPGCGYKDISSLIFCPKCDKILIDDPSQIIKKNIIDDKYKGRISKLIPYSLLSLILGIGSFFMPVLAIASIIFGIIGLAKKQNKPFAVIGIILSSLLLFILFALFSIFVLAQIQ